MLTLYTQITSQPPDTISFADLDLKDLVETLQTVLAHQSATRIWLGYLEGWMLTPQEETLLRPIIRALDCHLVCQYPHALSHAWKNETSVIYGRDTPYGITYTHNNGSAVQDKRVPRHGRARKHPPAGRDIHQGVQAGSSSAGSIQSGRD